MKTARKSDAETMQLLQEGARSYPEAMVALMVFRREVNQRCRDAVKELLPALGKAVGDNALGEESLRDWKEEPPHEGYVFLGTLAESPKMKAAPITFYFGLCWDEQDGEPWFGLETGFWTKRRLADSLLKKLKEIDDSNFRLDQANISIFHQLDPKDAGSFDVKLGEQIGRWISLGKKCGSYLKLLAEVS